MIVPMISILKIASGAIASTLAFSCVRNCLETMHVASEEQMEDSVALGLSIQDRLSHIALGVTTATTAAAITNDNINSNSDDTTDTSSSSSSLHGCRLLLLQEMKSLSRKESLCLFLSCPSISLTHVHGEWNGLLLDNNGWPLTCVTSFMTHQLFGVNYGTIRKRQQWSWNGKSFHGGSNNNNKGINRFQYRSRRRNGDDPERERKATGQQQQRQDLTCDDHDHQENLHRFLHEFDYTLEPSRLLRLDSANKEHCALMGSSCVALDYTCCHGNPFSFLWRSMRDEIRLVPLPTTTTTTTTTTGGSNTTVQLMIGLGSLGWSGGIRNASPFCLWRDIPITKQNH